MSRGEPSQQLLRSFLERVDEEFEPHGLARVADQVWAEKAPQGPTAARAAVTWSDVRAQPPFFRIAAFAGITILPVEQLLARTWPEQREPFAPAVQRELGSLTDPPEKLEIKVTHGAEAHAASALVEQFRAQAVPWIESLRDPEQLIEAIESSGLRRDVLLPATLFALGRAEDALQVLDSEVAALGRVEERSAPGWPSWASLFRQFSDALRAEILAAT